MIHISSVAFGALNTLDMKWSRESEVKKKGAVGWRLRGKEKSDHDKPLKVTSSITLQVTTWALFDPPAQLKYDLAHRNVCSRTSASAKSINIDCVFERACASPLVEPNYSGKKK